MCILGLFLWTAADIMAGMTLKNAYDQQPILPGPRGVRNKLPLDCRKRLKSVGSCLFLLAYACSSWLVIGSDLERCGVCSQRFANTIYTVIDKVTREKVFLCYDCVRCSDECCICGLPVRADYTKLADGRFLCSRDGKTAVLDETKAKEVCEAIKDTLDRKFSRFLTLPSTNVTLAVVDRVDLYDELTVVGNNFECPDIMGYIHSRTNQGGLSHSISLMSALPLAEFQATCAHEYAHAWVFENVSPERRKSLSRDAKEGFCELVAYTLMDALHAEDQMSRMLRNTYTRGQIHLFIEAEKQYGFNDVLDWMQWGVNPRLKAADLGDIRNVEMPRPKPSSITNTLFYGQSPAPAPTRLLLKGISSVRNQPLALINNQTFAVGESAKVRVGTTNVLVRCLAIGTRSVRIQVMDSGAETELYLTEDATR